MRVLSLLFLLIFLTFSWNAVASSMSFNNSLVDAADNGDIEEVKRLLKSGVKPDSEGEFGVTALMRASFKGHVDIAELLIKSGAYLDAADIGGDTALHMASRSGNAKVVKLLLHYNASVDSVDNQQWTPLMRAIMAKNPEITKILVDRGADLNAKNNIGNSSIVQAAISGKESVLKVLLSSNKFKDISKDQKDSSVQIAKKRGYGKLSEMISSTVDYFEKERKIKVASSEKVAPSEYEEASNKNNDDKKVFDSSEGAEAIQKLEKIVNNDDGAWGFDSKNTPFALVTSPYQEDEEAEKTIKNITSADSINEYTPISKQVSLPQDSDESAITSPYSEPLYEPKVKPDVYSGSSKRIIPVGYFADRYTIQIGAFSDRGQADYIWKNLRKRHGDILSDLQPMVLKVDDSGGASFYRLRVGSYIDKGAASKKCNEMQQ